MMSFIAVDRGDTGTQTLGVSSIVSSFSWLFFGPPPICLQTLGIGDKNNICFNWSLTQVAFTQTVHTSTCDLYIMADPAEERRRTDRDVKRYRQILGHKGQGRLRTKWWNKRARRTRLLGLGSFCRLLILPVRGFLRLYTGFGLHSHFLSFFN